MFDNYEDFFKKSDADIEELTYGQMMHALVGETGSSRTSIHTHHHTTKSGHTAHDVHRTLDGPTNVPNIAAAKAPRLIDGNYYEWIEADNKWIKIIEDSPEPPPYWEPGLFDGEIRKYIPE